MNGQHLNGNFKINPNAMPGGVQAGIEDIIEQEARRTWGNNYVQWKQNHGSMGAPTGADIEKSATNVGGNVNFWPSQLYKVDVDPMGKPRQDKKYDTRAFFVDPNYNMMNWAGGRLKPSSISFSTLRLMSYRCAPIRAIINTRVNQVSQIEWDIKLKDATNKPNIMQQEKIDYMKRVLEYPVDNKNRRMGWKTMIKALIEDSLAIDALCIEKVPNRRNLTKELYPVDGSTIFPNMNEFGEYDPNESFIQMIRGIKVATFKMNEMVYGIRRPRTDVYAFGYGMSELETIVDTVTSILFVDKYNRGYFSNNSIPDGVLSLAGEMDPQDLEAFKRYWISEVKGIDNFWKMPILNVPDKTSLNWLPFKGNNREMQYNIYYDWLVRIACAVYQIDPAEINVHGQPGVGSGNQSGGTIAKVEYSKDKGLRDIVDFVKDTINDEIVRLMFPELTFTWTGIDAMTKPERIEMRSKELMNGTTTVNEVRKQDNMEPVPWGDYPNNPTLMQAYMQEKAAKAQQQAMEQQQQAQPGMQQPGMGQEQQPGQEQAPEQGQQQGQEPYMPPQEGQPEEELAARTTRTNKVRVQDDQLGKRFMQGTKASVVDEIQRRNIPPNSMIASKPMRKAINENGRTIRIRMEY